MKDYQPRLNGNGEVRCPVDGCPTGLQRSIAGTHVQGVLAHLAAVHSLPLDLAAAKYRDELAILGEVAGI